MSSGKQLLLNTFILISLSAFSQAYELKGWHLKDKAQSGLEGISLNKTYDFLKGKKGNPIIVAVIDSGIDTTHEDLKKVLWINTKEIPGNAKDDDGNGYMDDIYGWNFLGGKDGRNIKSETTEQARVYHKYKGKFAGKSVNTALLNAEDKNEYALWKIADSLVNVKPEDEIELMFLEIALKTARKHEKVLLEEMKLQEFTGDELEKFNPQTQMGKKAKLGYVTFMKLVNIDGEETNVNTFNQMQEYISEKHKSLNAKVKLPYNDREEIVKDDYNDINDRFYGNNDVMGPSPMHGTHVSGIIAEQRNNGIGADGIAENVKLMMVRAIPDGDEYDKDVALAIRYAVDNGAKIINMSFGKDLSPEKKWVDEAIHYAALRDVLIVHAAGNDAANIDTAFNFPTPPLLALKDVASNYITVGAASDPKVTSSYVADFSNYGKKTVDVFAPGEKIYSTMPGSAYGFQKGTSMAAPVVSGIAAIIRSYYPQLSAKQVKFALEHSVNIDSTLTIEKPGSNDKDKFYNLCTSGGCVNAYKAIKLASTLVPADKEIKKVPLPKPSFKNKSTKL